MTNLEETNLNTMTYKIKSLLYFLGLLLAIVLYYTTEEISNQMEQTQMQLVENEQQPAEKLKEFY